MRSIGKAGRRVKQAAKTNNPQKHARYVRIGSLLFLEVKMIRERRGVVQSLVTALVTKPFMLLSGISGSGKTQLARRIAAGVAASVRKAVVKEEAPAAAPKNADPAELPAVDPMASVQKGKKK